MEDKVLINNLQVAIQLNQILQNVNEERKNGRHEAVLNLMTKELLMVQGKLLSNPKKPFNFKALQTWLEKFENRESDHLATNIKNRMKYLANFLGKIID